MRIKAGREKVKRIIKKSSWGGLGSICMLLKD